MIYKTGELMWGINIFKKFAKKFILYYIKKFVLKTLFCIFLIKIFFFILLPIKKKLDLENSILFFFFLHI